MEKGARITFLGTGGGRFVLITQLRSTGGWILKMDGEMLHIDPGPGALVRARERKVNLRRLTGVLVSHCHPDHYGDAEVVISAMTSGETKKSGTVIGSESVLKGKGKFNKVISDYFLEHVRRFEVIKPGQKTRIGKVEVEATPTRHDDPTGVGFIFRGSRTIGYTSDTEYFKGVGRPYKGCDLLILDVLRPRKLNWKGHMNSGDAVKIIKEARPRQAVIQQFGMVMLKAGPEKEAAWIEKESGVRTIAARDGMVLELD